MKDAIGPIIKQVDTLPALPATVNRVMAVTGDPESSAHELMQAILPDQSMCAALLKLSNSAFFGLPREVSTIEKAVMVLGFDEVRNIVLGKAVFNSFQHKYRANKEIIEQFWEHSFLCGLAAKIIAEEQGLSPSELFIAGLVHDIGKLVMFMSLSSDYASMLESSDPTEFRSYLREQERFAISHDDVATRLLNRWLFPGSLINTIGFHHRPQDSPGDQVGPIVIQIADILALLSTDPKGPDVKDIITIIDDFLPEIRSLWKQNNLFWNVEDLSRWQDTLAFSATRDRAILDIIRS